MLPIKHFLNGLNVGETWCSAIVIFCDTATASSFEKETHVKKKLTELHKEVQFKPLHHLRVGHSFSKDADKDLQASSPGESSIIRVEQHYNTHLG